MNIKPFIKEVKHLTVAKSPTIFTVIGVVGTVTTAYLASRASFKAARMLDEEEKLDGVYVKQLSKKEKFELIWKLYIPAVGTGVGTIACIIGANRIGTKRAAAFAAAASLSERALSEYRDKIVETLGPEEDEKIRQQIMHDKVMQNPPPEPLSDALMLEGDCWCHEAFTGRYFRSSKLKIERAWVETNKQIMREGSASVSDFYKHLGLPTTSVSDELGWNTEKTLELLFGTVMYKDQEPCVSFDFATIPMPEYWRFV